MMRYADLRETESPAPHAAAVRQAAEPNDIFRELSMPQLVEIAQTWITETSERIASGDGALPAGLRWRGRRRGRASRR